MSIEVLHAALECEAKVGGVGSVVGGLTNALANKDYNVSVVTPGYDVYFNNHFKDMDIEKLTTVSHIYKGKPHQSDVFRLKKEAQNGFVYHYLIRPVKNSPVERIFDIQEDRSIYQSLPWSESTNRLEYFNGAVAALLRAPDPKLPSFDIYHAHTWHTGMGGIIAKEYENLPKWRELYKDKPGHPRKIPYMISTIHMLLANEHGQLNSKELIQRLLGSLGLPEDFTQRFKNWSHYVNSDKLKQIVLPLLYSDGINMVSKGLMDEVISGGDKGQGLSDLFQWLHSNNRLFGILNGIDHSKFDATSEDNLGPFAFREGSQDIPGNLSEDKFHLKNYVAHKYPKLDPNKMWFGFIGRFALEKGVDWLKAAHEAITRNDGVFIIMGTHVVTKVVDGKKVPAYKELIDELRNYPNVLVIDTPEEQKLMGRFLRGSMDCVLMLSRNEACGLPQMEGFPNGAFALGPMVQGIPDSIKDLDTHPFTGSGFLYQNNIDPSVQLTNLNMAINRATRFYKQHQENGTMNSFLEHILHFSKKFDWNADPVAKYDKFYKTVTSRPLLTHEKVRLPPTLIQTLLEKPEQKKAAGKIFQIGFNKCGTQSEFFGLKDNGIKSAHYAANGSTLASRIEENFKAGRPLLTGIDEFTAYFDMEDIYYERPLFTALEHFKQLDKEYPGSKFILNTRNVDDWIRSRLSHVDPILKKSYPQVLCEKYNCTIDELIKRWRMEWDKHHIAVRAYFKNRPQDLLEYNIDTDTPLKICNFFADLKLDPSHFKHVNKTGKVMK